MLPANIPSYHAIACGREPQGSYHRCASLGPQIWPAAPADPAHAWHLWQSVASASWTTSNISKDGTYNLWLALTTSAWVLSCTNDHFSTLNCIRLDLATHAWLMSHKNGPITTLRCIHRSSCNSRVAHVVHKRSSAEARPNG